MKTVNDVRNSRVLEKIMMSMAEWHTLPTLSLLVWRKVECLQKKEDVAPVLTGSQSWWLAALSDQHLTCALSLISEFRTMTMLWWPGRVMVTMFPPPHWCDRIWWHQAVAQFLQHTDIGELWLISSLIGDLKAQCLLLGTEVLYDLLAQAKCL